MVPLRRIHTDICTASSRDRAWRKRNNQTFVLLIRHRRALHSGTVATWRDGYDRRINMAWTKPILTEIACGMEINMYAPAEDEPVLF